MFTLIRWTGLRASARAALRRLPRARGLALYLYVALAIMLALAIGYIVKGNAFAFVDVGSDTFLCFYPLQVAVARELHSLHDVTWSFDLGLGAYLGTLFDPLWLVTGWLPESAQLGLRLPMFLFRLLLGGGFFYGYLRLIRMPSPVAVIGALGYTFSSYALINAQWEVMHGTEFVQFAAYLYLFERFQLGRSHYVAVAAGFLVGIGHPFGLYLFALFGALYAAARLSTVPPHERAGFVTATLAFAAWCVVGIALAAPLLLPGIYYFLDNPRVTGGYSKLDALIASLSSVNDQLTVASEIGGLLGKDLLGSDLQYRGWTNYFESPGFYVGLLPLLCIPQLLAPRASRQGRLLLAIASGGIILYVIWPPLRYAVYGFGHIVFRMSTLWISALLLVLGLAGLRRALLSGWWGPGVAAGVVLVFAILATTLFLAPAAFNVEHATRLLAMTLLYSALLVLFQGDRRLPGLLIALCACELALFAVPAIVTRDAVHSDGSSSVGRYDDDVLPALDQVKALEQGEEFFRVEKTFYSVSLDDALVQNYPGTASYFHHASSLTRFVDKMDLPREAPSPNYISSMSSRPEVLDLLAVKYVLARDRSLDHSAAMINVGAAGDVQIYRNASAYTFASFRDAVAAESEADALPTGARDQFLLSTATVDDPRHVTHELNDLRSNARGRAGSSWARMRKNRDDRLYGDVFTPGAALLLLAMPFDRGWHAAIDGKPASLIRADFGLTALVMPAGEHQVTLAYAPPWRTEGFSLMAGALAFLMVFQFTRVPGRAGAF